MKHEWRVRDGDTYREFACGRCHIYRKVETDTPIGSDERADAMDGVMPYGGCAYTPEYEHVETDDGIICAGCKRAVGAVFQDTIDGVFYHGYCADCLSDRRQAQTA